ncbi:MAG: hypothetical protein ACK55I_33210, partial [bacterium]
VPLLDRQIHGIVPVASIVIGDEDVGVLAHGARGELGAAGAVRVAVRPEPRERVEAAHPGVAHRELEITEILADATAVLVRLGWARVVVGEEQLGHRSRPAAQDLLQPFPREIAGVPDRRG